MSAAFSVSRSYPDSFAKHKEIRTWTKGTRNKESSNNHRSGSGLHSPSTGRIGGLFGHSRFFRERVELECLIAGGEFGCV